MVLFDCTWNPGFARKDCKVQVRTVNILVYLLLMRSDYQELAGSKTCIARSSADGAERETSMVKLRQ